MDDSISKSYNELEHESTKSVFLSLNTHKGRKQSCPFGLSSEGGADLWMKTSLPTELYQRVSLAGWLDFTRAWGQS